MSEDAHHAAILFLVIEGERPMAVFGNLREAHAFAYQHGLGDNESLRRSAPRVEEVPFFAPDTLPLGAEPKPASLWASPELRRAFGALGNARTMDDSHRSGESAK